MKHKHEIKQLLILLCILKLYKKSNWLSSCTKTRTRKTAKLVLEKLSKVARSFVSIWWFNLISSHAWDNFRWSLNRSGLGFRASWVVWSSESQRSGEKYRVQFHRMITFDFNQLKWPFNMFKFSYYFSLRH